MSGARLFRYITIAELLAELGEEPNRANRARLLRRIRARERATGRRVLIQDEPGAARSTLRTTMALVRDALPELFRSDAELAAKLSARLESIEKRLEDCRLRNNLMASRIRVLMAELKKDTD